MEPSLKILPDVSGEIAGRSLEEWNSAYVKVENYFHALRIRNKPRMEVVEELPLTAADRAAGVTWQGRVRLGDKWRGEPVRVVKVEVDGKELLLATDLAAVDHHEGTITLIANAVNWDATDERVDAAVNPAPVVPTPQATPAPSGNGKASKSQEAEFAEREKQAAKKAKKLPAWTEGVSAAELDSETIDIDFLVYMRIDINSAEKAVLEVEDYRLAVVGLATTTLRAVLGLEAPDSGRGMSQIGG